MNISRIFIERPVMTALVTFAILLFGVVAFRSLPVAALPTVDYPNIQVTAALPGASPETMASSVATPLEREFSTIAGVKSMSSQNSQGATQISVQFTLSRSIDAAAQDIQAAIAKAEAQLPASQRANFRGSIALLILCRRAARCVCISNSSWCWAGSATSSFPTRR